MRQVLLLCVLPRLALAYGEPGAGGVPSHRERLLHTLTNQVRQAPHAWPGWDTALATPDARPPLAIEPGLFEAARFHADDMSTNDCFQHESCDGTPADARIARYFSGAGSGENIYTAFGDDSVRSAITSWMTSDGHRTNILRGAWTHFGAGASLSDLQVFFVQDFGEKRGSLPPIPSAAFEPRGGDVLLVATWYDEDGRPPRTFDAILDGETIPLPRIAGVDGNETRAAPVGRIDGCAELVFAAEADDGVRTLFPTDGALLAGERCTMEYTAETTGKTGPKRIDADDPDTGCSATRTGGGSLAPWIAVVMLLLRRLR
jgi:hypothetical protein